MMHDLGCSLLETLLCDRVWGCCMRVRVHRCVVGGEAVRKLYKYPWMFLSPSER